METSLFATLAASRWTFLALLVVGTGMCTPGIGKAAAANLWLHPISFAGYLLGATALLLLLQGVFRVSLIPVTNSVALVLVLGIIVVKVGLAFLYPAPAV
jgi:uncharacterized membrane protein YwaF